MVEDMSYILCLIESVTRISLDVAGRHARMRPAFGWA